MFKNYFSEIGDRLERLENVTTVGFEQGFLNLISTIALNAERWYMGVLVANTYFRSSLFGTEPVFDSGSIHDRHSRTVAILLLHLPFDPGYIQRIICLFRCLHTSPRHVCLLGAEYRRGCRCNPVRIYEGIAKRSRRCFAFRCSLHWLVYVTHRDVSRAMYTK